MDFSCLIEDSYENLLEYQNILHNLDMKMIKCEHVCFINEDTNTLLLAEEEYNSKLKDTLRTIWNKIIEKLEEFIILMRKIINRFRNTFLLSKEFKASMDSVINNQAFIKNLNDIVFKENKASKVNEREIEINSLEKSSMTSRDAFIILSDPETFNNKLVESLNTILETKEFNETTAKQALENFSKFKNSKHTSKYSKLTKNEIVNTYNVLTKYAPEWIGLFEKLRNEAKQKSRLVFNTNPDRNAAFQASIFQRMINKGIMYIQSIMTACFKVCYAIKNVNVTNYDTNIVNDLNRFKDTFNKIKNTKDILKQGKFLKKFIEKLIQYKKQLIAQNNIKNEDTEITSIEGLKDEYSDKDITHKSILGYINFLDNLIKKSTILYKQKKQAVDYVVRECVIKELVKSNVSDDKILQLLNTGKLEDNIYLHLLYFYSSGNNGNNITNGTRYHTDKYGNTIDDLSSEDIEIGIIAEKYYNLTHRVNYWEKKNKFSYGQLIDSFLQDFYITKFGKENLHFSNLQGNLPKNLEEKLIKSINETAGRTFRQDFNKFFILLAKLIKRYKINIKITSSRLPIEP